MVFILLLSFYLAIVAAIKKRYIMFFLALASMSFAALSLVRNSYHFVQVCGIASIACDIALIILAVTTISVLYKKE